LIFRELIEAPAGIGEGRDLHQLALARVVLMVKQMAKEGIANAWLPRGS
jgi:hypothetical protein